MSDTTVRVMPEPSQKRKRAKTGTFLAIDQSMTQAATDTPAYVAHRLLDLPCPQSQVRRDSAAVQSLPQPRGGVPLARTRSEAFLSHLNAALLQQAGPSIDRHGRAAIVCMLPLSLCPLEMLQRSTDVRPLPCSRTRMQVSRAPAVPRPHILGAVLDEETPNGGAGQRRRTLASGDPHQPHQLTRAGICSVTSRDY